LIKSLRKGLLKDGFGSFFKMLRIVALRGRKKSKLKYWLMIKLLSSGTQVNHFLFQIYNDWHIKLLKRRELRLIKIILGMMSLILLIMRRKNSIMNMRRSI
jgi:hypothetical protein